MINPWPLDKATQNTVLETSVPRDQLVLIRKVAAIALGLGYPLYIVGGWVRDLLLGIPTSDIDLVVEGEATQLARALVAKFGGKMTFHTRFGTAKWFLEGIDWKDDVRERLIASLGEIKNQLPVYIDLVSARTETYTHPTALPEVHLGTLTDDLRRRDFSINTLALRLDGNHFGELVDLLGGIDDLRSGILRALHPLSFTDDPTRLFRIFRYEQRYGFRIEPETLGQISGALPTVVLLSPTRIRHEFERILDEDRNLEILARLGEYGILNAIHPKLCWNAEVARRISSGMAKVQHSGSIKNILPLACQEKQSLIWAFWLINLSENAIMLIDGKVNFGSRLLHLIVSASKLQSKIEHLGGLKPSQWVDELDHYPWLAVLALASVVNDSEISNKLLQYINTWRRIRPVTNGTVLKSLGIVPGPRFQEILKQLRGAWINGEIVSEEQEIELLDKLVKSK